MTSPGNEMCAYWKGYFGRIRCKFEPRYDKSEPINTVGLESLRGSSAAEVFEAMRRETYVRDVCVRCGKTVERNQ